MEERKEKFYGLIEDAGFTGLRDFARHCDIQAGNIYSNVSGKYKLSIERAFIYANTLGVHIDDILAIFYPKEMEENYEIYKENYPLK